MVLEIAGILLALVAALGVMIDARVRRLPIWATVAWTLGTFLLLIVVLPIYVLARLIARPSDEQSR